MKIVDETYKCSSSIHLEWSKEEETSKFITDIKKKYKTFITYNKNVILLRIYQHYGENVT